MSKLIVVALEESESRIFDKILEIVNQTKKCEVETIDGQQQVIQIGVLPPPPANVYWVPCFCFDASQIQTGYPVSATNSFS